MAIPTQFYLNYYCALYCIFLSREKILLPEALTILYWKMMTKMFPIFFRIQEINFLLFRMYIYPCRY